MYGLSRRALLGAMALAPLAVRAALRSTVSLGAAWRGPRESDPQQLGVIDVDWERRSVAIRHAVAPPSRAHGLMAEPQGGLFAVAARPGHWLMRLDAQGRVMQQHAIESDRSFDGHVLRSADGQWLYTAETDAQGRGHVSVREHASLRKVDDWRTHGIDPHHMMLDAQGHLLLANGGIARDAQGRKRDLDRMASSLARIDTRSGALLGQWSVDDARLSLRHLAWSDDGARLGVAIQAEHDDAAQRAAAPLLALWDGDTLTLPTRDADGGGYAGDIAAAALGGFALSAQRSQRGVVWWPQRATQLARFAEVQEPCALASAESGAVLMACGAGIARWHPTEGAAMLRWPQPMALDNHWVVMQA